MLSPVCHFARPETDVSKIPKNDRMCKLRQFNEDENNGPCQLGEGLLCYNGLALQERVGREEGPFKMTTSNSSPDKQRSQAP